MDKRIYAHNLVEGLVEGRASLGGVFTDKAWKMRLETTDASSNGDHAASTI